MAKVRCACMVLTVGFVGSWWSSVKAVVVMSNCEVKRSRKGEELEILVTKHTEVEKSEKVFDVESTFGKAGEVITLKELHDFPFQRVTDEAEYIIIIHLLVIFHL